MQITRVRPSRGQDSQERDWTSRKRRGRQQFLDTYDVCNATRTEERTTENAERGEATAVWNFRLLERRKKSPQWRRRRRAVKLLRILRPLNKLAILLQRALNVSYGGIYLVGERPSN